MDNDNKIYGLSHFLLQLKVFTQDETKFNVIIKKRWFEKKIDFYFYYDYYGDSKMFTISVRLETNPGICDKVEVNSDKYNELKQMLDASQLNIVEVLGPCERTRTPHCSLKKQGEKNPIKNSDGIELEFPCKYNA